MPLAGALKDKDSVHNTDSQRGSQAKARPCPHPAPVSSPGQTLRATLSQKALTTRQFCGSKDRDRPLPSKEGIFCFLTPRMPALWETVVP